jgi:hypothetical protein
LSLSKSLGLTKEEKLTEFKYAKILRLEIQKVRFIKKFGISFKGTTVHF